MGINEGFREIENPTLQSGAITEHTESADLLGNQYTFLNHNYIDILRNTNEFLDIRTSFREEKSDLYFNNLKREDENRLKNLYYFKSQDCIKNQPNKINIGYALKYPEVLVGLNLYNCEEGGIILPCFIYRDHPFQRNVRILCRDVTDHVVPIYFIKNREENTVRIYEFDSTANIPNIMPSTAQPLLNNIIEIFKKEGLQCEVTRFNISRQYSRCGCFEDAFELLAKLQFTNPYYEKTYGELINTRNQGVMLYNSITSIKGKGELDPILNIVDKNFVAEEDFFYNEPSRIYSHILYSHVEYGKTIEDLDSKEENNFKQEEAYPIPSFAYSEENGLILRTDKNIKELYDELQSNNPSGKIYSLRNFANIKEFYDKASKNINISSINKKLQKIENFTEILTQLKESLNNSQEECRKEIIDAAFGPITSNIIESNKEGRIWIHPEIMNSNKREIVRRLENDEKDIAIGILMSLTYGVEINDKDDIIENIKQISGRQNVIEPTRHTKQLSDTRKENTYNGMGY